MQETIEKRLEYFFRTRQRRREEVQDVVVKLQEFGPVVVIGGMIRDLALVGNRKFGSDVDFVVKPRELPKFETFMHFQQARRNMFGGYMWPSSYWRIDVWAMQRTWAHEAGHVKIGHFPDLLNATFFDCDAVMYELEKKRLLAKPDYFERLGRRELEINLLPNPNPIGNAVRALRYAALKGFGWRPKLCMFMVNQILEYGWEELEAREMRSFGSSYVQLMDQTAISRELKRHLDTKQERVFNLTEWCGVSQLELGFDDLLENGRSENGGAIIPH